MASPKSNSAAAASKRSRSPAALMVLVLVVLAVCVAVSAGFVFNGASASESTNAKVSAAMDPPRAPSAKQESATVDLSTCGQQCKIGGDEVCGTDGKTYLNECFFKNAQCKNSTLNRVADWKGYNCPHTCKKQITCKEIGKFLCASDGNVYFGYCNLFIAQCLDASIKEVECDKAIFN